MSGMVLNDLQFIRFKLETDFRQIKYLQDLTLRFIILDFIPFRLLFMIFFDNDVVFLYLVRLNLFPPFLYTIFQL